MMDKKEKQECRNCVGELYGERIAKIEQWKGNMEEYVREIHQDVKSLKKYVWISIGAFIVLKFILDYPQIVHAFNFYS